MQGVPTRAVPFLPLLALSLVPCCLSFGGHSSGAALPCPDGSLLSLITAGFFGDHLFGVFLTYRLEAPVGGVPRLLCPTLYPHMAQHTAR